MDISLDEILKAVGGQLLGGRSEGLPVHKISTDTRTAEKDDVFFALKGSRFDGHDFIKEAEKKGVRHFVVSDPGAVTAQTQKTSNVIGVDDTLKAYGDLAKVYRQKFKIPAIAITGSAGKTTVKELIAHVLSERFRVLKNRGTENNLIGVPKTIFQLEASHEVMVLEMGTNHPGEIDRLSSIIAPQIGIVTQIGFAHLEGLTDLEGVKEQKLKLLNHLERGGVLVLNGQDSYLAGVQSGTHKILRVGFAKEGCELSADQVGCLEQGSSFHLGGGDIFETPLIGRHNVLNGLFAIAAARALGLETPEIQKGLGSFKPVPGRLNFREMAGIIFLDDSYNSNPTSFRAALETLKEFKIRERKAVVCGDMLELGEKSEMLHREMGALIAGLLFDYVIAAGPESKYLVDEAVKKGFDPSRIHHTQNAEEAGKLCQQIAVPGDRVLVKGSRGTQMEKVFECFIISSIR